jgi:hypothetical protein
MANWPEYRFGFDKVDEADADIRACGRPPRFGLKDDATFVKKIQMEDIPLDEQGRKIPAGTRLVTSLTRRGDHDRRPFGQT